MSKSKANNIYRIPCSTMEEFYKNWIDILTPIHKLTSKNKQILLAFLMLRYELAKSITNETLLDEVLMNEDSKAKIKERCNLQGNYLQVAPSISTVIQNINSRDTNVILGEKEHVLYGTGIEDRKSVV